MRSAVSPCRVFLPVLSLVLILAPAFAQTIAPPVASHLATVSLPSAPLPVDDAAPAAAPAEMFLPSRSQPPGPRLHLFDWAMIGTAAALRVLDYTSTEKGIANPKYLHEAMLPAVLVSSKPAFAAFEAGAIVSNYFAYRFLVHRHMRSLARVSQYMYVGIMTFQVAHNYQLIGQVPAN